VSGGGGKEGGGARVCVAAGQCWYICTSKASKLSTCVAAKEGKEVLGGGAEAADCTGGGGPPAPAAALRVIVSRSAKFRLVSFCTFVLLLYYFCTTFVLL
jgi:hypothetical protein